MIWERGLRHFKSSKLIDSEKSLVTSTDLVYWSIQAGGSSDCTLELFYLELANTGGRPPDEAMEFGNMAVTPMKGREDPYHQPRLHKFEASNPQRDTSKVSCSVGQPGAFGDNS